MTFVSFSFKRLFILIASTVFIVAPRSLNLEDTEDHLLSTYKHDIVRIGTANQSTQEHQEKLKETIPDIKIAKKNQIVTGAPRTLKECYIMKENKIIPNKVMYLNDSLQSMANFYLSQDEPITDEEAEILAQAELKDLLAVKEFYKGCVFDFNQEDSQDIDMINVRTIYFLVIIAFRIYFSTDLSTLPQEEHRKYSFSVLQVQEEPVFLQEQLRLLEWPIFPHQA